MIAVRYTYGDLQRYRIGDGRMWLIPARCYYDCLNRLKEHGITIYATAEDVAQGSRIKPL